jgi:hypothetical protein
VRRSSIADASVQVVEATVTVRIRHVEPLLRDTGGRLMRQWRPANELVNIGFSAAVSASVDQCVQSASIASTPRPEAPS